MLGFFYTSINNLVNLQVQIQSANLASKRINDILSLPSENSGGSELLAFEDTLNLKNISISYGKRQILSNINLLIKKNKKIAIIGESGSGKSTLAKVIANLIKVNSGEILIDDINIEKYSLESIRRLIHYVPQDLYFFKGTIRDNIILNKNTKQNDILEALSRAEISNLLEEESLGLDTIIESNGLNLSGGQKKRLAIARSLLIQAEIIIFDEITNGLSSKQEKRIISNLIELNQQTIIFLTHSELIPKYCDEVWIINNGKLTIKTN
jgi:ABC-type bacteriocin/lantibiotic exporter with double-glycine peptidase domain